MPSPIRQSILLTLILLLLAQALFMPKLLLLVLSVVLIFFAIRTKKTLQIAKRLNLGVIIIALSLIYLQYGTFLGVEAGVAILISFLFGKVLESQNKRDWVVVFNFALFVSASSFLYSSSIWMSIVVLLCLISCLMGLYRLHQLNFAEYQANFVQETKQLSCLIGYALPFFLLLFIFFPRLPPLWHMPIQSSNAITGMSEQMAPGDIANLSQSSALAFRIVTDIGALPARQNLYWRAMVLDQYDGRTWQADRANQHPVFKPHTHMGSGLMYQYLGANPDSRWVMGLEYSLPTQRGTYVQQDGAIRVGQHSSTAITLNWLGGSSIQPTNPAVLKRNQIYLAHSDPQAQQLAQQLYQQSGYEPQAYMSLVLNWYQSQGFQYSLSPGRLQGDHIDDFLFNKRLGFCEHYAASFVMLMRYVGIPARVVIGYQGGQSAPDGKSWEVRQLDAHAWSEIWLDGRWQRIDPTAAIAPARIEQGIQNSVWQQASVFKQQQFAWSNRIHIWSDFIAYQWQSKIAGYDQSKQINWLTQFGLSTPLRLGLFLLCAIVLLIVGILAYRTIRDYFAQPQYERILIRFNQQLHMDLQKLPSETHAAWLERLSIYLDQDLGRFLQQLATYDRQYRYAQAKSQISLSEVKLMLKKCSVELGNITKPLS